MGQLESFNPASGELVGTVETIEPKDVDGIAADIAEVQPFWAQLTPEDRGRYLRRVADELVDDLEGVARLISTEQGKPMAESYVMELIPTIDALHWCADEGPHILRDEPISYPQIFFKTKRSFFSYEPIGVVGVIAPWNYPWSIPFGEVAIALMCGNGVILKPASLTPLLGDRIQAAFERGGVPEGLVRTVHGGGQIGQAICESRGVGKVFFTGSVEVGRKVGEICASQMKGSVLELGGKDPQIVCADADLENAVSGCVWGAFANAGQTCSGIERTYVMDSVADRFLEGVVAETERLTVGDPLDWTTEIGPMVSADQAALVSGLVDDAVKSGADRLCGGPRELEGMDGSFIAPIVLAGVEDEMRVCARRSSAQSRRSSSSAPRRRHSSAQTTRTSAWAPRSGPGTAKKASEWRGGSSPGWSGSMTTPIRTARFRPHGEASRNPVSAAPTPSSAFTSA